MSNGLNFSNLSVSKIDLMPTLLHQYTFNTLNRRYLNITVHAIGVFRSKIQTTLNKCFQDLPLVLQGLTSHSLHCVSAISSCDSGINDHHTQRKLPNSHWSLIRAQLAAPDFKYVSKNLLLPYLPMRKCSKPSSKILDLGSNKLIKLKLLKIC